MFRFCTKLLRPLGTAAVTGFFAASLIAQTSPSVTPNRIQQRIDDNTRVTLHGYVHPLANAANDRGPAPDSMPLERMHLVLKRSPSQEAALEQMITEMHTPGNPNYHKWLTPDAFGKQFGPSDQDMATVESWLSSQGFQVTGVKPGRQVIEFAGNVAQFRNAFHAAIHQYMVNGNLHYAAAADPQIPAAIAPVVGGFVSLNNFRPKQYLHVLGQASYDAKTHVASPISPNWTYGSSTSPYFVLAPADFAVQYDLNPLYGSGIDGRGETIAVINESNINLELVQQFRKQFLPGYPATNLPTIVIDGNDPGIDGVNNPDGPNYASDETYIDVEWAGAVAPNANIDLVIGADTSLESGLYLAAERAIYGDLAPIMSLSFGACEAQLGSTNAYLNDLWEQAAAEGITVVVSAGDNGSAGCDNFNSQYYAVNGLAVSGFASTPWNVAVGGTDFYYSDYASGGTSIKNSWNTTPTQSPQASLNAPIQEQPWNDSQFGLNIQSVYQLSGKTQTSIAGGSGGASSAAVCAAGYSTAGVCNGSVSGYPKPSWQAALAAANQDKVRDLPDVSLFAADGLNKSFYPFCFADGDCQPPSGSNLMQISGAGGTSFGAPAFAGIMALVDQQYGAQGQADVVLYPLKAQFPAAFHEVTVGTNAEPCNTTSVSASGQAHAPVNCIPAPSGLGYSITDPTYGVTTEGELGVGSTPGYEAASGYSLATGLGSIDANALVSDWNKISFTGSTVTLTATPASITHGQAVTIGGTVTGSGTVGGNVALMTNSVEPGQQGAGFGHLLAGSASTFAVSGGSYSGSVNDLPGGTYNVWAQYSGDGTNGPSTSAKTQIVVNPEASSIAFSLRNTISTSSVAPSVSIPYGTQLIPSAAVYGSTFYTQCIAVTSPPGSCSSMAVTPATGTVTFSDNGSAINTAVLNVEGDAEFNAPFPVGAHSVTASYSGDASYQPSTAAAIPFTVVKNTPLINAYVTYLTQSQQLDGSQQNVIYVQVMNSANVSTNSQGNPLTATGIPVVVPVAAPTGTITVSGLTGATVNGTLAAGVDPSTGAVIGTATIAVPASSGSPSVTISYSGDTNYAANSTGSFTLPFASVGGSASTTSATITGSISAISNVTLSGTVTGSSGKAPSGTVNILSGGYIVAQATLTSSTAQLTPFNPQRRRLDLFATGGGALLACVLLFTIPARRRAWRNMLGVLVLVCMVGFTLGCGGGSKGSGSGGCTLGPACNGGGGGGSALTSNFSVALNSRTLLQGSNIITVQYLGDSTYGPSSYMVSTAVNNPLSDFTMIAESAIGVAGGNPVTVDISSANGFSGTVGLNCSIPSGAAISCKLSQSSVALTAGSSSPATLAITSSGAAAGYYPVTITGTAGNQIHTLGVTAAVQ